MSITPDEAAYEEWYGQLADEISEQAIEEFTEERLRSYYLENPNVAERPIRLYLEAKELVEKHRGASLVLFVTAIEVGLKVTLLKPIVYGLVHNESLAELIADLAVKKNGFDRVKTLLSRILADFGGIDLMEFKIDGHPKTMWEEITKVQDARNLLIHRAQPVSEENATLAMEVAEMILGTFLSSVLATLRLELRKGAVIGRAWL